MKIGIPNNAFSNNKKLIEELQKTTINIVLNKSKRRLNGDELIDFLNGCDIAIIGMEEINEKILQQLPELKFISKFGVGMNNINLEDLNKYNVKLKVTEGVNKRSVSELTLGFILNLIRNISKSSSEIKNGIWNKNGGLGLSSLTLGVIGFGNVGKDLIKLVAPFDIKILVNDIKQISIPPDQSNLKIVDKDYLFKNSDIVTIHTPLTNLTFNMINKSVFEKMKIGSFIVNTSRGGIINEDDLYDALNRNIISGAALDVYENEPPLVTDLIKDDRVITTPHIAGNSNEAVINMGMASIKQIIDYKNSL
jgi:phosphoglycerate dehydrogenase-like enzyme